MPVWVVAVTAKPVGAVGGVVSGQLALRGRHWGLLGLALASKKLLREVDRKWRFAAAESELASERPTMQTTKAAGRTRFIRSRRFTFPPLGGYFGVPTEVQAGNPRIQSRPAGTRKPPEGSGTLGAH